MRNNSAALVKLCMLQTLFEHILLQPSMQTFNVSILQSIALSKNEADRVKLLESRGRTDKEFIRILRKVSILIIILPCLFSNSFSTLIFIFSTIIFKHLTDQ